VGANKTLNDLRGESKALRDAEIANATTPAQVDRAKKDHTNRMAGYRKAGKLGDRTVAAIEAWMTDFHIEDMVKKELNLVKLVTDDPAQAQAIKDKFFELAEKEVRAMYLASGPKNPESGGTDGE
jgi:hypothetical protein